MPVPYGRLATFYFCYFATLGAFLPFWSLYLQAVGFAAEQIGELTAAMIATKIVAPYLWGWLADKTGRSLGLIRITTLFSALVFVGFELRHDYVWVMAVTLGFSFFWNATLPLFEAATLLHLRERPQHYSRVRLWGSIGFIAAVLGIGHLLDTVAIERLPWLIGGLLLANTLVAWVTPDARRGIAYHDGESQQLSAPLGELLAFFTVYMLLQVAHGPYYTFYSVYLQYYGYPASLTGLLWSLGVVAEIGVFIAMSGLLKRVSLRPLLLLSLLLSSVRWWLIGHGTEHLPVLVFAQLLHAASFGITHVVAMQLLHRYFGEHHLGKGQALYSSLSFGVGGVLGSYFSGYWWDALGGNLVFVAASLVCGLALIVAFVGVARQKPAALG
ncbi:MAG: MFS transporter [Methylomonas sp.]|nr:MFS transporter [Methylomonas sp.]PPD22361.1 MAG: MFS transporter [Methylomonas sp.]PPD26864.1 MAG: MFS transporter [Methylomonas sp.]PPD38771.1 MAG: MFS transporter [Methylomonas sp.]PPD40185.1 MAG: MFS transporter [Methylomonas sp.]